MPLLPGKSREIISKNISTEMHAGCGQPSGQCAPGQAAAISYSKAGLSRKKKEKK